MNKLTMVLGLGALLLAIILNGCGFTRHVDTSYYYPDWMPDGRIVCIKNVSIYEEGPGYSPWSWDSGTELADSRLYITIMSEEGSQETDIKEVDQGGKVVASRLGNYIAMAEGKFIKIMTSTGIDVKSIEAKSELTSIDWGPEEDSLVYSLSNTSEVYKVASDGSGKILISNAGYSVAWRVGNKVVYDGWDISNPETGMVAVDSNNLSQRITYKNAKGGYISISKMDTNEVVYSSAYSEGIKKFYLSSPEAAPILLVNRDDIINIHLSPNAKKIIGSIDGNGGICLINVDGTGFKQLR